ncbi:MAG TPA: P-loop NTPase fold protein, partial [Gemmataceae bacterium]|nr:P-loop NTPase fold protein [Gemmataceae bacterium]
VSGAWGVGKSSMINLIRRAMERRAGEGQSEFVFVEFNAWLYQGYDDARAALMEVIATTLKKEAEERKSGLDKVQELLKRVDWLRTVKLAGSAGALGFGLPPIGLVGEVFELGKKLLAGKAEQDEITLLERKTADLGSTAAGLLRAKPDSSPPKEIQAIRQFFEEALAEMKIKLVVLIDDLDRCLPPTTISTLEAIRLFLFLKNTAFVIAADDAMIKHAVRQHFAGIDEESLVISYFDKLIQVPIRVPPLGTQEVRAYLMLLFVENSALGDDVKESIRTRVCEQLGQTWRGRRVDRAFMQSLGHNLPAELIARLDTADRLAPVMTGASQIAGNPRLIKRFLNALSIRLTISRAHDVGVDEAALVKMLLFERCSAPAAYAALTKSVVEDDEGKPRFLGVWEERANAGEAFALEAPWDDPFVHEWLTIPPRLADRDLRGILYVSREHAPLIAPEDRLSSEGAELLAAMVQQPEMAAELRDRLIRLSRPETTIIMDRLLDRARQEREWGTPPILDACLAVAVADPAQGRRLAGFLRERPPGQIKPGIVPKIGDQPWALEIFDAWNAVKDISVPVKRAITQRGKDGNVRVQ